MKRLFLLLVVLILAGCAAKTATQPTGEQQTTYIATLDKALADSKTATEAKNSMGYKMVLETSTKKAKVGDYVVIGVMVNNLEQMPKTFFLTAEFFDAIDFSSNKITEADAATMKTWLDASEFSQFTIENQKSQYVPVVIKVGEEIASGIKTKSGTYQFRIKGYYIDKHDVKKQYDTDKSVYVTVQA